MEVGFVLWSLVRYCRFRIEGGFEGCEGIGFGLGFGFTMGCNLGSSDLR